ncbi:pyridoxal phosphate-dependent aminotransferase [Bordetella pseudohinzii]|uniref:Methionine aminotransferase n=1 Tax=Bordetella pseudohinzii TaxID=1331258 RepID=A0A0J6BWZ9_9BORD|nr:pyridoxal phosphate-dependent aminotransferase [Bordetella pseudohinzii]ANY18096.1 methionine aminotransferase [Bordetella pseudohinzii]KMM26239.1 aminotransferase [Bordetella pseudohinzii]KXA75252.1 aminotransferase [Bordetella pseudohinzii]KXA75404.1 aminotransferase [Bordetella pseudohinzii]CUJ19827.1 Methionine aminotransferase [Bordetella pseudohinzii]
MIRSKLPDVGTTIFTVMSRLAIEHQAINLGQGFPDFDPDPKLRELVTKAMDAGHNQYPYMPGVAPLRAAIADKVATLYGHRYDPETEITVTSGATEALMATVLAAVNSGDEVVVIEPCYDSYLPAIRLAGGTAVPVPMRAPTLNDPHYRVDWQRVRDAVTPRTRLLMLNFPHNPTGAILDDSDLDALEAIVRDTGILLLADEVYEHIVFDGKPHASIARRPLLAEHAFVISSFGKTYHTTGWKIGYCCAPRQLSAELRKVHQFMVFTVSSPMQYALAAFMADPRPYLDLPAFYETKRNRLAEGLAGTRFRALPSPGTFFMLADYSEISKEKEGDFAQRLTIEHGVTVIPVSAFYRDPQADGSNHHIVRFCFAKKDATLDAAIERLAKV